MTRLLLDSHIFLAVTENSRSLPDRLKALIEGPRSEIYVSTATLWELAIKFRLGKLPLLLDLRQAPELIEHLGYRLLQIHYLHVLVDVEPEPLTKDPFDRLLLGVCAAENLRLVTLDRALADHPLAWQAVP